MLLALTFLALSAAPAPETVLASFTVPMWGAPTPVAEGSVRHITLGGPLVLWTVACEQQQPMGDDEPKVGCVPARLMLPDSAPSFVGVLPNARAELRRIRQCYRTRVAKAPADVVTAAAQSTFEAAAPTIAAQPTPTLGIMAMRTSDFQFAMGFVTAEGDVLDLPRHEEGDDLVLSIVDGPRGAAAVARALERGHPKAALKLARAGYADATAPGNDPIIAMRAAGNVAVAAFFAHDKSAVPAGAPMAGSGVPSELASTQSATTWGNLTLWAHGELWLGNDPCRR